MRGSNPFNQDLADEICLQLASGKSLAQICREDPSMPPYLTIFRWLKENEQFAKDYARAREDQAEADADAISDIASRVVSGELDPQAARVAIDAYKWTAGKRLPKKYGDKLDLTSGGDKLKGIAVSFVDGGRGRDDE